MFSTRTKSGEKFDTDVIIFATGFDATEFLAPMTITGGTLRMEFESSTKVITLYLEGINDGRRFVRALRKHAKPPGDAAGAVAPR